MFKLVQLPMILGSLLIGERLLAIQFKAIYLEASNQVRLNWDKSEPDIRKFTLQLSTDQKSWIDIAQQNVSDYSAMQQFQFIHREPNSGNNFYRLKILRSNGTSNFSTIIQVNTKSTTNWVMYPVPMGNYLTLEYKGSKKITGVINIFIALTSSGKIFNRMRCSTLNRVIQIPVGNLGAGIFDISIVINDEITWHQRFVK